MSSNDAKNSLKISPNENKDSISDPPRSPDPSHIMDGQYAVLMETSEKESLRLFGNQFRHPKSA